MRTGRHAITLRTLQTQRRHILRTARWRDISDPDQLGDFKKEVLALYRDCMQSIPMAKELYSLSMPVPMMRKRIRMLFEMNSTIKNPLTIYKLLIQGAEDLDMCMSNQYTAPMYLNNKYFSSREDMTMRGIAEAYQNREMLEKQRESRDKRVQIALGGASFPMLPGTVHDADGNRVGYSHPKGPLPQGESEMFARPPKFDEWGEYPLPDPWNPHNRPEGPPNPFLLESMQAKYNVHEARMGPYNRHRIRRFLQHEQTTRVMSEAEYLEYFEKNEAHMLANKFELPEYSWAEDRLARRTGVAASENQGVFGSARAEWIEKYKAKYKGVSYGPAIDFWCMSFKTWTPNYNKAIVENKCNMRPLWNEWISAPARYAVWKSPAFQAMQKDSGKNPLAQTMRDWVRSVDSEKAATKPYDSPDFVNKWHTDNGLAVAALLKEDEANGLGVPHGGMPVLHAEMQRLKDEIGCVQLSEKRLGGEWWNRGQIRLMSALATLHDMELGDAMLSAAGVDANASGDEAARKIAAHDWSTFSFTGFSCLRYPDGDERGIHSWPNSAERWQETFLELFSHDQCVPQWMQGLSERATMNKPVAEGGWTLEGEESGFYDQLMSY